jgi:hypothetical protein
MEQIVEQQGISLADLGSTITQFLDYLDNFARYKEEDSLHSIAALFDAHPELSVVEKALLGNTRRRPQRREGSY